MSDRFSFGNNWQKFISGVSEKHIDNAVICLRDKLGDLSGKSFLDAGSGSGIHSLAAIRLGAIRVHSFDYDRVSVECTRRLKDNFAPDSPWTVEHGSALDPSYLSSLGRFDVVYSWGVLHHTGDMWKSLTYITIPLETHGLLFISLYNDQGHKSRVWRRIKKVYNSFPSPLKPLYVCGVMAVPEAAALIRKGPGRYLESWSNHYNLRGMSKWHDLVDWVGGYPFEVAAPDAVVKFFGSRGFSLHRIETTTSLGCNEFVFTGCEPMRLSAEQAIPYANDRLN